MNVKEFGQEPVLVDDFYPARLVKITEYQKDYGQGPVDKLAWVFRATASEDALDPDVEPEEEFIGSVEVAAHTFLATGPKSKYAQLNLPAFVEASVDGTWDGDTDPLVGKECEVYVESYETKGGQTRNVVTKVRLPRKKARAALKKAEEDFEDIAF
jgi:hypothetical protein